MANSYDDSPLRPAVDGTRVKSFEEFLDISLQEHDLTVSESCLADDGTGDVTCPQASSPIKRPFLKKGSGLARFRLNGSAGERCVNASCSRNNRSSNSNSVDKSDPKPWARRVESCVQVLPKTQTRSNLSLSNGPGVTVSRVDSQVLKGHRGNPCAVNHEPRPSGSSKSFSRHVPPIPPSPSSSARSSSTENLERLLHSVRGRKEQVFQKLGEFPVKSSHDAFDFDEDNHERDSFDDEDEQSWTDHSDDDGEEDLFRIKTAQARHPKQQQGKKVRWSKENRSSGGRHHTVNRSLLKTLDIATPGPYTLYLAECISSLQSHLEALENRCGKNLSNQTGHSESLVNDAGGSSVSGNNKNASTGNSDADFIRKEVSEIKKKISSITEDVRSLQLLTSQINGKVKGRPEEASTRKKVIIQRAPNNQPAVTTRLLNTVNSKSSSNKISEPVKGGASGVSKTNSRECVTVLESGDTIQKLSDGTVIRVFKNGTKQTTFIDGSKVIQFPTGQVERTMPNGVKHINYPNHSQRIIYADGSEEMTLADGTILRVTPDGTEVVILPNGEREIRSSQFTRREYANGTVKTIYQDGIQETRYPNGRVRIKDKFNNVLLDSITS